METELKDLIGKKVERVFINEQYLLFVTDAGDLAYRVNGDCCSTSFFYDFYGVPELLKNGKVTDVKTVKLMSSDLIVKNKNDYDWTQVYGFQIFTESEDFGTRTSVFSFRNVSNGYYGGDISRFEGEITMDNLKELKDDVVEVK